MAVLQTEVKISGPGEDIWLAVLGPEVRISGPGEDIWVAVLGPGRRICHRALGHQWSVHNADGLASRQPGRLLLGAAQASSYFFSDVPRDLLDT